ncbi:MAG: HIT domain-containing protein [Vicinamibacterales bacterium]
MTGNKAKDCVFCLDGEGAAAQRALIVHEGRTAFVILNLYPYNNGHLMVVPYRHLATLAALSADELQEVAALTQLSEAALTEAYQPHGINVGINLGKPAGAGVESHLHVHLVPRWNGDTNFMTVVGEMRVLPEDLASSAARLRPIFAKLASVRSAET